MAKAKERLAARRPPGASPPLAPPYAPLAPAASAQAPGGAPAGGADPRPGAHKWLKQIEACQRSTDLLDEEVESLSGRLGPRPAQLGRAPSASAAYPPPGAQRVRSAELPTFSRAGSSVGSSGLSPRPEAGPLGRARAVREAYRTLGLPRSATAAQVEAAAIDALSDAGSEAQRDAARAAHAQIRGARRPMAQV